MGPLALSTLNQLNAGGCMGDGTGLVIAFAMLIGMAVAAIALVVGLALWLIGAKSGPRRLPDDAVVLRGPNE